MPAPYSSDVGNATSVSVASTSTLVLAGNPIREGAILFNAGSVTVYLSLGFAATTTLYSLQVPAGSYLEIPFAFAGVIYGITASGTATVLVTEFV